MLQRMPCLVIEEGDVGAAQHAGQCNQRQTSQGSGVATIDFFQNGDAQAFIFSATGTIIRLFYTQVSVQFGIRQIAEGDKRLDVLELDMRR